MGERVLIKVSGINPFDRSYNEFQSRYDKAVMNLLSKFSNFSMQLVETPLITNLNLYEKQPNIWILEQLLNGTCEMSSTTMVLTPEITYSTFYSFGISYFRPQLFYKARSVREEHNIYYIPFSPSVWISLFALLLVITVALTFILGMETKLPHDTPYDIIARMADEESDGRKWCGIEAQGACLLLENFLRISLNVGRDEMGEVTLKESLSQRERWEIGEILLIAIGALGQQGSARDPSTSAARTLLLVMFSLAVVAYTAYSASVISLVSLLPNTEKEQRSLTRNVPTDREVVVSDTNFFRHHFRCDFTEVTYSDTRERLDDTIHGKMMLVGDRDPTLTLMHRRGYEAEQRCSLARVFLGIQFQRVFAIRKNLELKEKINRSLIRLQAFGLMSREKKRIFNVRYLCSFKERISISGFVSFDIQDIEPALLLLGSGFILSFFLFLLEIFTFSSSKLVRKVFSSCWTSKDFQVGELASKFVKTKNISIISERRGDLWSDPTQYRIPNSNPLIFMH